MYIRVRFGSNEEVICNPSCAVINLLSSIKRLAGYNHTNVMLDLCDETGLVKDLSEHHYDYANKFLSSHATYVLVEKQLGFEEGSTYAETDGSTTPLPPNITYIALLDNAGDHFPNFNLRSQHIEVPNKGKSRRNRDKSPSPAGIRGKKGKKELQRTPSQGTNRKTRVS